MKDSYSFDLDRRGPRRRLPGRTATRTSRSSSGSAWTTGSSRAVSGAMGGSAARSSSRSPPTGEDTYVSCTTCDYAANVEAATVRVPDATDPAAAPALEVLDTPDTPTIETLVDLLRHKGYDVTAAETLKNVVLQLAQPDGERPAARRRRARRPRGRPQARRGQRLPRRGRAVRATSPSTPGW